MIPNVCPTCGQVQDDAAADCCRGCGAALADPADAATPDGDRTIAWEEPDGDPALSPTVQRGVLAVLAPPQEAGELGRLGPYRVRRILGTGGMGVVFLADDPLLRRPVALKAMLPAVADKDAARRRFVREAQAAAMVKHPNVVTIYQVGEDRGHPYMAMEYLVGEGLDSRLAREPRLPLDLVLQIGRQTAGGLAAAHACGLIHRDIKPANLRLARPDDRAVILDFGLARPAATDIHLTVPGLILGTPAYMSPEQARGQPLDARADLFSLGALLYRLCTGAVPFRGTDTLAVLTSLATETPRPVWEQCPDAPWPLVKLIDRLLAKDPAERPATAAEVEAALAAVAADRLTVADLLRPLPAGGPPPSADDLDLGLPVVDVEVDTEEVIDPVADVPLAVGPPALPALPADRLPELAGRSLGSYDLGAVLGRGQHGVTFRARDSRSGQAVALRVLPADFPQSEREIQAFTRACGAALPLRHPHLVALLGAGRSGPYCWIAQELVEGHSVAQLLARPDAKGRADWRLGLRIALHGGRALHELFVRRHKHGNITPSNLLVRTADGAVLLNDVRFAQALRDSALYRAVLDRKVAAEWAYLAPEQVESEASFVDALCDVYSLGAVVYTVMTGRPLFVAADLEDAIHAIRHGAPPRPRKLNKAIPRELEWAVLRMLAKRQEDRYPSPAALLDDLLPLAKEYEVAG